MAGRVPFSTNLDNFSLKVGSVTHYITYCICGRRKGVSELDPA